MRDGESVIGSPVARHRGGSDGLASPVASARSCTLSTLPTRVTAGDATTCIRRGIGAAELAAASIWISNWCCMLPVINSTRTLVPTALLRSVLDHVFGPVPLGRLVHDLSLGDPSLVRGAIFEHLRRGRIRAPSLHTQLNGQHTVLEPAS
jgi:hypothetical protein